MASDYTDLPEFLATREGEAHQANFSTNDYGRSGDQRPYQIVQPAYPAPQWLARFVNLKDALRTCDTLCQLKGKPFRLMKWGGPKKCFPCARNQKRFKVSGLRVVSPGALKGYPGAQPVAEFNPSGGNIVYGEDGAPQLVGQPNFVVTRTPNPPSEFMRKTPMSMRYQEAVYTAQRLAGATGHNAYICSSMGANCKVKGKKGTNTKWTPMVYVSPGGLVKRYPHDLRLPGATSVHGSQVATTSVTPDEFRELVRQSEGRTRLAYGA